MGRKRRIVIDCEDNLEYPLMDLDAGSYIGPEHLPPLSDELKSLLRTVQRRWENFDSLSPLEEDTFAQDAAQAEERLTRELAGTDCTVVRSGERTEEARRRRRKSKRKRR